MRTKLTMMASAGALLALAPSAYAMTNTPAGLSKAADQVAQIEQAYYGYGYRHPGWRWRHPGWRWGYGYGYRHPGWRWRHPGWRWGY